MSLPPAILHPDPVSYLVKMAAEVGLEENSSEIKNFNTEQESIPVGCVPPAYWPCRGCPGVYVSRGLSLGLCPGHPPTQRHPRTQRQTPPLDRQTPVKTLPCPKLRLRAVNIFQEILSNFDFLSQALQAVWLVSWGFGFYSLPQWHSMRNVCAIWKNVTKWSPEFGLDSLQSIITELDVARHNTRKDSYLKW